MEHTNTACRLCPRGCGALRTAQKGACGVHNTVLVARAAPHLWEEPCISGTCGSGTVFFCGCPLGCVFCQNHAISRGGGGKAVGTQALADIFLRLQNEGVHNINLVSATQFRPAVQAAIGLARKNGLVPPLVWNTGGYETIETVDSLQNDVQVWLTDLKFFSPALSAQLANAPDYFATASAALHHMVQLCGAPRFDENGLLQQGVVVRLLVLPGQRQDAKDILHWLAASLPRGSFLLSLMRQYTPPPGMALAKPFNRRVAGFEYDDVVQTAVRLGLTQGFSQEKGSAAAHYTPPFDGTGVE